MLVKSHLDMKAETFQPHLNTTIQAWYRVQDLVKYGEIEIDGNRLDIPGVVAVAWSVEQISLVFFELIIIVIIAYPRSPKTQLS
jgi:hypothetical protein